ncbi:ABC transporter substrate-binding protein [Salmonirosea aquatica]|uniref:ABC transporter substrate-binding protein n=1 Tax=Salmonirosea aquatica TaxID=2654236 RepID=A0A7C9FEL2_9BACT|nr:ABC transporter substrate-binding protein [Cytophagaceae bacterium SJW1-29]
MRFLVLLVFLSTVFQFIPLPAKAQILNDRPTLALIQKGINHIYNNEFEEANAVGRQIQGRYPEHPVTYFLKAFQMHWQYLPIKDNKAKVGEYIRALNQCLAAVDKQYGKNSKEPEAVFFTMASRGYLALMYNYQNELLKAAGEAQKAYGSLTEGLKLVDKNPEFYFVAGMYNYYVESYPEDHPIVKPLMIFFKDGNKTLGLKQLDMATKTAVITKVEAAYFLAHIYLEHEARPDLADNYTARLSAWFPNNLVFKMSHLEALILAGRYDEADKGLPELKKHTTGFYPIAGYCFEGMIAEKRDKNDAEAQKAYLAALKIPYDMQYTREYHAMSYAGLARIADRGGNKAKAREYYKKSLEITEYLALKREAKAYLK